MFAHFFFLRNPLDSIRPEVESVLRYLVWSSTLLKHHRSVGQNLLGIRFGSEPAWRLRALAVLDIFSHYCHHRAEFLLRVLPGSEQSKYSVARMLRILSGRKHSPSLRNHWTYNSYRLPQSTQLPVVSTPGPVSQLGLALAQFEASLHSDGVKKYRLFLHVTVNSAE